MVKFKQVSPLKTHIISTNVRWGSVQKTCLKTVIIFMFCGYTALNLTIESKTLHRALNHQQNKHV